MREFINILNENGGNGQQVSVIYYNTGYGQSLAQAAKDPKCRKTVNVVGMTMDPNSGAPTLKFNDEMGGTLIAHWDAQFGWHADMD